MHNLALIIINLLTVVKSIEIIPCSEKLTVCKNPIYCEGDLLRTVQLSGLFQDSKTFVDMSLVNSPEVTLKNFRTLKSKSVHPSKEDLIEFVTCNFKANDDLEMWIPPDFKTNPEFLTKISNKNVREFAVHLNNLWLNLGRKVGVAYSNPKKFSIISVPNGFIIPGGRFREYYYWDSYWIIKGLLICDMTVTAKGMIENFLHLINKFGFVPNGGRIYYLDRSQPPLLLLMVEDYIAATQDFPWLRRNLKTLEIEMQFWIDSKMIQVSKNGESHLLAHYSSLVEEPRPESYREDVWAASNLENKEDAGKFYSNVRSGAESGWDFSSRWVKNFDKCGGDVTEMQPARMIPVDLNAILCRNFRILYSFHQKFSDKKRAQFWLEKAENLEKSIEAVLYDENEGIWFDYDTIFEQARKQFFPSNFAPLWLGIFDGKDKDCYGEKAANYLRKNGILEFLGGIPASLTHSGEQWDWPNAWPPSQSMVIFGLENTGNEDAKEIAKIFADRWIKSTFSAFQKTNEIFEKYNARIPGMYGSGGEYQVQTGFGWTNGGLLELIDHYYIKNNILD